MKRILARDNYRIEKAVVLKPLREAVLSATGYDENDPYKSLGLSNVHDEDLKKADTIAKNAEKLLARIESTYAENESPEEQALTRGRRYDCLVSVISEYEKAEALVQAFVADKLNKAISSMNHEFMPINYAVAKREVKKINAAIKSVHVASDSAFEDVMSVFGQYKMLDPATRMYVRESVTKMYRAYLLMSQDEKDKKDQVSKAFYALPRSKGENVSFDIEFLYQEENNNENASDIKFAISLIDPERIQYEELIKYVEMFNSMPLEKKAGSFTACANLLDAYCRIHRKSSTADEARRNFKEYYYDQVSKEGFDEIVEDCRVLKATTTAQSRNENAELAKTVLSKMEEIEGDNRNLVRPIVIDTMESFNDFELSPVVAPLCDRVEPISSTESQYKYSPQYYVVLNALEDSTKTNYSQILEEAKALSLKEQSALLKETENEFAQLVLSNHIHACKALTGREQFASLEELVATFMEVSDTMLPEVFGGFMRKYVPMALDQSKTIEAENILDRITNALELYTEAFEYHKTTDFVHTVNFLKTFSEEYQRAQLEVVLSYFESFVGSNPNLALKAWKCFEPYISAFEDEDKYRRAKEATEVATQEVDYMAEREAAKRIVGDLSSVSVENVDTLLEKYRQFRLDDAKQFYPLIRRYIKAAGENAARLDIISESTEFDGLKLICDIEEMDAEKCEIEELMILFSRCSEYAGLESATALKTFYAFYCEYCKEHPRIANYENVRNAFESLCNTKHSFAAIVAAGFGADYVAPVLLSGAKIGAVLKVFEKCNDLPLAVREECMFSMHELYEEHRECRTTVSSKLKDKYKEIFTRFIDEEVTLGQCREEYAQIVKSILFADKAKEIFESILKGGSMKSIEQGGYMRSNAYRAEKILYNICRDIEGIIAHQESITKMKAKFSSSIDFLKKGIDLRKELASIRDVRKLPDFVGTVRMSSSASSLYAAAIYKRKIEKLLLSATPENQYYIIVKEGTLETEYKIERMVNAFCLIVRKGDERFVVVTDTRIEMDISRDDADLYSVYVGRSIVKANPALNEQIRFSFNKKGRPVLLIRKPISSMNDYEPGDQDYEYPVKAIVPEGIRTVVVVRDPETNENFEIITSIRPADLYRRIKPNVIVDHAGRVFVPNAVQALQKCARSAVEKQKASIRAFVAMGGSEESKKPEEIDSNTYGLRVKYGRLEFCADEKSYIVVSAQPIERNGTRFIVRDEEDNRFSFECEGICSYIINEAFDMAVARAEKVYDPCAAIVAHGCDVCLKQVKDEKILFTPIYDIRNEDGKAVIDLISADGNYSVSVDYNVDEALRLFASQFKYTIHVEQLSPETITFEKIDETVCARCDKDYAVISVLDDKIFAAGNEEFVIINVPDAKDKIKIGKRIVTVSYDESTNASYSLGAGETHDSAILNDLPIRNVKMSRESVMALKATSGVAMITSKNAIEQGDLARVVISEKQNQKVVCGIGDNKAKVEIYSPSVTVNHRGEILVSGYDALGKILQYRVVSTAFGEYEPLISIN